jgi:hypothetical protein
MDSNHGPYRHADRMLKLQLEQSLRRRGRHRARRLRLCRAAGYHQPQPWRLRHALWIT